MKFTWYGKENAIIESMTPSTGALRPDKESSKNWDNTENLYIEGDNLEVLKLLQKSYFGKVKMIYIDPPYNTGKDFIYKDNFKDNIANYKEITNQSTKANPETNGRYHTDWLNMMHPRLKLARNLLKEDGIIFISIDDNEVDNLKKLCDEVFGELNSLGKIIWRKKTGASDSIGFSNITEYILVYIKDILHIEKSLTKDTNSHDINRYKLSDEYVSRRGKYYTDTLDRGGIRYSDSLNYPIECPDGTKTYPNGRKEFINDGWTWTWGKDKLKWGIENGFIEFRKSDSKESGWSVCYKNYLNVNNKDEIVERSAPHKNLILDILNTSATLEIKELFGAKVFQYTKPKELILKLISFIKQEDELIVLDFFSGSSTTAHAVMLMNLEENSNIKYIMVQLPELTEEKSEAYKAGYKNICEIGKERIRRAGDKIISENKDKEGIENLDIGFKVFKLEYNCGGENNSTMEEGIKVDIIKRPKDKPICKFKVDGELYYLVKTSNDIIVFPYKSSIKGKAIASIFNIKLCKNKDYMQLEYLYNMKLNEFNGEDFIHSQYVTSVILDNVYNHLND